MLAAGIFAPIKNGYCMKELKLVMILSKEADLLALVAVAFLH